MSDDGVQCGRMFQFFSFSSSGFQKETHGVRSRSCVTASIRQAIQNSGGGVIISCSDKLRDSKLHRKRNASGAAVHLVYESESLLHNA